MRASFVDDAGNAETRTSDPTEAVAVSATAPRITIAPDRPKATGRFDFIYYTLTREGSTSQAATVTVTLEPPAGNDWEIDADKIDHEVTFGAGEATKTLVILLKGAGFPHGVGFSNSATASGTLGARLGRLTGYAPPTPPRSRWCGPGPDVDREADPARLCLHRGCPAGAGELIEVEAASAAMPAPSRRPGGAELIEVSFSTDALTGDGAAQEADYLNVSAMVRSVRRSSAPGRTGSSVARCRSRTSSRAGQRARRGREAVVLDRAGAIVGLGISTWRAPTAVAAERVRAIR